MVRHLGPRAPALDRHNKKFYRFPLAAAIGGTTNICSGLFAGNDQALWVSTRDEGLLLFDKTTGSFHKVRSPDNPTEVIRAVNSFQSNAHTIWLADQKKLYRYNSIPVALAGTRWWVRRRGITFRRVV